MPEDQLRSIVEDIRARLQAELDRQLTSATEAHEKQLAELRRSAEAEADRRWASKLESARADWNAKLQSEVAATRSEVERTMVAESMRARVEAEQAAAEAASRGRRELEQAVAAERQRAQVEIDRLNAEIEQVRKRADRELAQARAAFEAERASTADALAQARTVAAASSGNGSGAILDAVRAIDESTSLSTALAAVARAAAKEAPRVALFVVQGTELREWPVDGVAPVDSGPIRADGREAGFLSDVLRSGEPRAIGQDGGTPPAFSRLSPGRSAVAVPVTLGGQPVALLYADDGNNGQSSGAWRDTVQILGRHASAFLGYLTAIKTAQAMHLLGGAAPSAQSDDEALGARRYARLLVSEIKLYNEGAVRVGRERRDLRQRLRAEIDRARKLYEERIPAAVRGREAYFEQELVHALADGDQSLLG